MRRWACGLGALAALVCIVARTSRFEVVGGSMRPTLDPGDRLVVWRTRRVEPGWLVLVPDPRDPARALVKRVVRVVGDAVELRGDNPAASTDSRAFGVVPRARVRGRAVYRYHPRGREGRLR